MVDFKKLKDRTEEERAKADEEIEQMRQEFLNSVKNDPAVKRMKKMLGEK